MFDADQMGLKTLHNEAITLLYIIKILRIWHAFCRASSRPFLLLFEQFKREKDAVSRTIEKVYRDERDSELWHDEKCANKLINLNKTSKWRNETFHMFYCIIPTSRHWNAAWLLVPTIDWFWWVEVFVNEPHRYQGVPTKMFAICMKQSRILPPSRYCLGKMQIFINFP